MNRHIWTRAHGGTVGRRSWDLPFSRFLCWNDMKVAIMQPYLFPYIGYFQLINAVDKFVIYDDVQFIKGGWINRNRFLIDGKEKMITFNIKKDSTFLKINQRYFVNDIKIIFAKHLDTISHSYKKAPNFKDICLLLKKIFSYDEKNVSKFIINSLRELCKYMDINTELLISSNLNNKNALKGEERVIYINKILNSSHYINSIGGVELYNRSNFEKNGIKINFLKSKEITYNQFYFDFVPNLSIIDVLMFNSRNKIKDLLKEYKLI